MNNNRKLADEYYISEERLREFFDKYTKLTFVSMDEHLFSKPPSCYPSIIHNVTVSWRNKEYNISFELCDDNSDKAWVYNIKTNLKEDRNVRIGNHCFGYIGFFSELSLKWFAGGVSGLETIRELEIKPQLNILKNEKQKAEELLEMLTTYDVEEVKEMIKSIDDKISVLSGDNNE